nr:MAG TPA: Helicase REPLICATION [Caudoviricetes sp.]
MRNIIYSSFSKDDPYYIDYLKLFEEEADNYKNNYKIDSVLSDVERKFLDYIISSFESSGETPSKDLFIKVFNDEFSLEHEFDNAVEIGINDFRVYIFNLIDRRVNKYISERLDVLNQKVKDTGITDEIAQEFTKLTSLSNRNKAKDIEIEINSREEYNLKKERPVGLITGIPEIDDKIGGMSPGTVSTIAGFTSQYKCVSENERVYTNRGLLTMKEIYTIGVHSDLMVQSEFGMRKLVAVHDEGTKKSYIIYIGGIPVETSPVHRFRVLTDNGLEWVEAQNLKCGDRIVQSLKQSTHDGLIGDKLYWEYKAKVIAITKESFDSDLFTKSVECWKFFISELFRHIGYVIKGGNTFMYFLNVDKAYSVSHLLSALGISTVFINNKLFIKGSISLQRFINVVGVDTYNYVSDSFYLSTRHEEDLGIEEFVAINKDDMSEFLGAELVWNTVTDIEESECYMYDLTVEGSPTYCLNGYVTHNTTMALNVAHLNAYELGYNVCYLSLETPKEDINWNLLSCHSYDSKFSKYNFVGHDKMRRGTMTSEEEDFIFNEVEPDLKNDYVDDEGYSRKRGKVVILDESDFKTFSFGEISAAIEKVDDKLGGKLDCVIVDYIQLCKFSGQGVTYDANSQINSYVTFFRRLAQNFKKEIKEDGTEDVRQLTMILLAQINRSSWQKASRNDGRYDITCLADANELERGSARVFTTYTSEDLKARKSAQVQILKNRAGQTMYDPVTVYADGESYVFMSEDNMNGSFSADGLASVESAFANMDDDFDFM